LFLLILRSAGRVSKEEWESGETLAEIAAGG